MVKEKESKLFISTEILKSAHVSIEQLQQYLIELRSILGKKFDLFVPKNINDVSTLQLVISLSQRLQKLKECEGFEKHVGTYTKKQLHSSYFVTVIASYLFDRVDSIILEPPITGRLKKPDILASLRDEQVYLECKYIDTSKFDYSREHEHMFSILHDYIDVPHQVSIRYKKPLSDTELHQLGETLRQRLEQVTGDGRIIHNANLEVQVMTRQAYGNKRLSMILTMIEQDTYENCSYPGHAYGRHGLTVSLSGPKVEYTKVLREKIRKSRRQSPQNWPYVLMINGNLMLGDLTENIRALSTAFQPKTNTRFSAAVLVTYHLRLDSLNLDFKFYLVSNPFAKFPVSKEFERLFHTTPKER